MTYISVDPMVLRTLSDRIADAVAVADEVARQRGRLEDHLDGEHPVVGAAARSFLDRWAYACERLAADVTEISSRLDKASECYVEVDESAAGAFRS